MLALDKLNLKSIVRYTTTPPYLHVGMRKPHYNAGWGQLMKYEGGFYIK